MEHYLTPDEERTFTPKLEDLAYAENENTSDEEEEEHDTDDFTHTAKQATVTTKAATQKIATHL
jgi:hypothetical protein